MNSGGVRLRAARIRWISELMMPSLDARLQRLEQRHMPDHTAALAAAAEQFRTKLLDLADRMVGREPDPATMTEVEQVACLLNTDPAAAIARIKARAAATRTGQAK